MVCNTCKYPMAPAQEMLDDAGKSTGKCMGCFSDELDGIEIIPLETRAEAVAKRESKREEAAVERSAYRVVNAAWRKMNVYEKRASNPNRARHEDKLSEARQLKKRGRVCEKCGEKKMPRGYPHLNWMGGVCCICNNCITPDELQNAIDQISRDKLANPEKYSHQTRKCRRCETVQPIAQFKARGSVRARTCLTCVGSR